MAPRPPQAARAPPPAGSAAALDPRRWVFAQAWAVVSTGWRRKLQVGARFAPACLVLCLAAPRLLAGTVWPQLDSVPAVHISNLTRCVCWRSQGDDCWALREGESADELVARYDALGGSLGAGETARARADDGVGAEADDVERVRLSYRARMWRLSAPQLVASGLLYGFYSATQLAQPLLIRGLVESVRDGTEEGAWWAVGIALAAVSGSVAKENALAVNHAVGGRLRAVSSALVFRKRMRLNVSDASQLPVDVSNLLSSDAQKWLDLMPLLHLLWAAPAQIVLGAAMLVFLLGWEALAGVAVLMVAIPLNALLTRRLIRARRAHLPATDRRVQLTTESAHGMRVLKLNGLDKAFEEKVLKAREEELPFVATEALVFSQQITATVVLPPVAALVAFAAYLLSDSSRELTPETAWPVLSVFSVVRFPIMYLSDVLGQAVQTWVSSGRLERFLGTPDSACSPLVATKEDSCDGRGGDNARRASSAAVGVAEVEVDAGPTAKRVVCRGVDFFWGAADAAGGSFRVHGVDVAVAAGERLFVVGAVGSGKSTLVSGLLGECRRSASGSDGGVGQCVVAVRGSCALAAQTPWIQNASLRDNILYGRPMRPGLYRAALSAACLWPDIAALHGGDRCVIGERGVTLSGGQKARVALARAAYAQPDILVLDDPLSALDAQTQRMVFERLLGPDGMCGNAAVILTTHATSLLRYADKVLLLDKGRVAAYGPPRELLQRHGGPELSRVPSVTAPLADLLTTLSGDKATLFAKSGPPGRTLSKWLPPADDDLQLDEDKYADARQKSMAESAKRALSRELSAAIENGSDADTGAGADVSGNDSGDNSGGNERGATAQDDNKRLGFATAIAWTRAAGGLVFVMLLLAFFLWERAAYIGGDVYLAYWTNDTVNGGVDTERRLMWYSLIVLANVGGAYARTTWFVRGGIVAAGRLFGRLIHKVFRAPMSLFETTPMGDITNRLTYDVETMDGVLIQKGLQAVASMFWWLSGVGVMAVVIPYILLALIPVMAFYGVLHHSYLRAGVQAQQLFAASRSPLQSHLGELVAGAATVRASCAVPRVLAEADALIDYSTRQMLLWMVLSRWLAVRVEILGAIVSFSVGMAAWALRDTLEASFAGLAITWAFNFSITLNFLVLSFSEMESKGVSLHRILQYCRLAEEAPRCVDGEEAACSPGWPAQGALSFQDVSLRYRPSLPLALNGLNVDVSAREKVGICGRTGSGKSTIATALFRLTELAGGRITLDGVDLATVGLLGVRGRACAIIPQDPLLFRGTLRFNLDPLGEHGDFELVEALRKVGLRDRVLAAVAGRETEASVYTCADATEGQGESAAGDEHVLDAPVDGGGANFSHGQRQLICTARALLKGARVIVLDEATASCDAATDALLQGVFRRAFADSTVLTVAHRLATIADSDRIWVMSEGRCVEHGPPDDLMQIDGGAYRAMVACDGQPSAPPSA